MAQEMPQVVDPVLITDLERQAHDFDGVCSPSRRANRAGKSHGPRSGLSSPKTEHPNRSHRMARQEAMQKTMPPTIGERSLSQQRADIRKTFTKPRHLVLICGGVLACCAGIVNTSTYLNLGGHFVSHMSGTVAHMGVRLEAVDSGEPLMVELRYACLILLSFILGAMLCGMLVAKNEVYFGKSLYGAALVCNSALLVTAVFVPWRELSVYLAAAACGLQNGMCTMHFGAVVRTTHVTGIVTDLGTSVGRGVAILLRRGCRRSRLNPVDLAELEVDLERAGVFFWLLSTFFIGCFTGAYLQRSMRAYTMLVPAAVTGTGGILYMFFRNALKGPLRQMGVIRLSEEVRQVHDILEQAAHVLDDVRRHAAEERGREASAGPAPHGSAHVHPAGMVGREKTHDEVSEQTRRVRSISGSVEHSEADLEESIGHMLAAMHDVEAGLKRFVSESG